jgi:hypothetical protein
MRLLIVALALASQAATPIFRFETDGFWLNLHHFLYVLGRVEAKMPDIQREAVAGAPADQAAGLKLLSEAEQQTWREAVKVYAGSVSRVDAVFDARLVEITNQLKRAASAQPTSALTVDTAVAAALDRAAPIYRRVWWTRHREANRAWVGEMQPYVTRYGPQVLAYVTKAYQEPWATGGYPINVSAWSNWAGAYSTSFSLLVISSTNKGNAGSQGFEITFHESMHQWDDAMQARLLRLAKANNLRLKNDLSHAMIFYTAGEAVRSIVPGHTPYAETAGIWQRSLGAFKPALDAHWKPYLEGKTTLDEALVALLKAT